MRNSLMMRACSRGREGNTRMPFHRFGRRTRPPRWLLHGGRTACQSMVGRLVLRSPPRARARARACAFRSDSTDRPSRGPRCVAAVRRRWRRLLVVGCRSCRYGGQVSSRLGERARFHKQRPFPQAGACAAPVSSGVVWRRPPCSPLGGPAHPSFRARADASSFLEPTRIEHTHHHHTTDHHTPRRARCERRRADGALHPVAAARANELLHSLVDAAQSAIIRSYAPPRHTRIRRAATSSGRFVARAAAAAHPHRSRRRNKGGSWVTKKGAADTWRVDGRGASQRGGRARRARGTGGRSSGARSVRAHAERGEARLSTPSTTVPPRPLAHRTRSRPASRLVRLRRRMIAAPPPPASSSSSLRVSPRDGHSSEFLRG